VMESEHNEDGNKKVSGDELLKEENGDGEHIRIHSEENGDGDHTRIHSEENGDDSPPVQVMDRDDNNNEDPQGINYDPNRIPLSVFERSKSNIQAEWSCTSNESLFSLHLGRNSFTVDMMKSGELYKSGELLAYSPALPMPPPPGPGGESNLVESKVVDDDSDEEVVVVLGETHREKEEDKRDSHEKEQHPAVSWKTPTTSYRSNRSSNSAHSFTFPILAGAASESGKKETEEQKKQAKQSQEMKQPEEAANQKQTMWRWFSCFPSCPWCCSSRTLWPCS
ncbi:unnamed protein product, partial [Thlaspi arvense]